MRQIERRKRGPIVDRREPARVAMGQDIERTAGPAGRHRAQYAKAMLAYGAVQLDILVADGGGAGIGSGGAGLGGKRPHGLHHPVQRPFERSEEHTSELQSLMRISYAVLC